MKVSVQLTKMKCFPFSALRFRGMPLNFVPSCTFRKVFDTRCREVVDICLEMFHCVDGGVNFWKSLIIPAVYCVRHSLLKPIKNGNRSIVSVFLRSRRQHNTAENNRYGLVVRQ